MRNPIIDMELIDYIYRPLIIIAMRSIRPERTTHMEAKLVVTGEQGSAKRSRSYVVQPRPKQPEQVVPVEFDAFKGRGYRLDKDLRVAYIDSRMLPSSPPAPATGSKTILTADYVHSLTVEVALAKIPIGDYVNSIMVQLDTFFSGRSWKNIQQESWALSDFRNLSDTHILPIPSKIAHYTKTIYRDSDFADYGISIGSLIENDSTRYHLANVVALEIMRVATNRETLRYVLVSTLQNMQRAVDDLNYAVKTQIYELRALSQ